MIDGPRRVAATACALGLLALFAACDTPAPSPPAAKTGLLPAPPTLGPTPSRTAPASRPPAGPRYPYGAKLATGSAGVALTFDDGPSEAWTGQILAVLRKQRVKATFCVLGRAARAHPSLIRQIAAEGHTQGASTLMPMRARATGARHYDHGSHCSNLLHMIRLLPPR